MSQTLCIFIFSDKIHCAAMRNGYCTVCSKKCIWNEHKNMQFYFDHTVEIVKECFIDKKLKYEKANGEKMNNQVYLEKLTEDVENLFKNVQLKMIEMQECKSRLHKIALRPDPLSATDHIDLMIEAEKMEKHPGYDKRIQILYNFREKALIDKQFENFDEHLQSAKKDMESHGIPTNSASKKEENILQKGGRLIKNLFSSPQN